MITKRGFILSGSCFCERYMFQLPQNDIYLEVGTGKHAYYYYMPYVMHINHVTNSNYMARKPSNFYIFLMQRIDYILTKKGNFNEICTMFIG